MFSLSWLIPLIVVIVVVRNHRKALKNKTATPPGPRVYPVIGSLLSFPQKDKADRLHKLSEEYGDVMHFNVLGQNIVVLSSEVAANDLLDKRSAIYSDRPRFAAFDMLGFSEILSFLPYGPAFHRQRKMMQEPLTRSRCTEFQDMQTEHATVLLRQLLVQPTEFIAHVRRFTASVLLEITYGHKVQSSDDAHLRYVEQVDKIIQAVERGAIIEMVPVLKRLPSWFPSWFPGAWFVRYVRDTEQSRMQIRAAPFEQTRAQMAAGTARPCFVSGQLEEMNRNDTESAENLSTLSTAGMQLWLAGTDTTWITILIFIFAILLHPEAQRKAQEEIDRVVGSGRLPDFSDRDSLPYLECLLQECRRWNPSIALAPPHRVMEDDVYRGMLIPKGSTIIVNARALTLDPKIYHDPREFRPERFLPETGEPHPTGATFGYGRRFCVGRYLAEANVWIAAASLLTAFDIVKAKDEFGQEIAPDVKMIEAIMSRQSVPFKCEFRARSREIQKVIEDT